MTVTLAKQPSGLVPVHQMERLQIIEKDKTGKRIRTFEGRGIKQHRRR